MNRMDHFGLTEEEKEMNLHSYNHALFQNMLFFMDIVWEINILTRTVVILHDKNEPHRNSTEFQYAEVFRDYMENRVKESGKIVFGRFMSPENVVRLAEETSFDVWLRVGNEGWDLHRIVLTPAFDEKGVLYCVYLGARNLRAEVARDLAQYHGLEQFRNALMAGCYFHFEFDVTGDAVIHEDLPASDGVHLIEKITGVKPPVSFAFLVEKWFELYRPRFDKQDGEEIFTVEYLKRAFARNDRLIELEVKQTPPGQDGVTEYEQMFIVLIENPADKHIHACVILRSAGFFHQKTIRDNRELEISNRALRRTVSQEEQFRLAVLSGSLLIYNINLMNNRIEDEFYETVDGRQYPMLELMGLSAPCDFDEFRKRWCEVSVAESSREVFLNTFNREYMLDAYRRGEKYLEVEFDTTLARGIPITLRNVMLLVEDKASKSIIAMVNSKDVTAQRREEVKQREALREAYEAANSASRAKTDFLARMSHDIRTPMNAIIGMTAIAGRHLDDIGRVTDCLQKISVSSKYLLALLDELLDMSKIEAGTIELEEEKVDLVELLDGFRAMCEAQAKGKGHSLTVDIHRLEHGKVWGDGRRMNQLLMNLMDNAIKYTPNHGRIRFVMTELPTNKQEIGCYEFTLEDNGIGMSADYLKHLFEPFTRAQDRYVEKVQGTGLGLAIARSIVQMMNGTIDVQSKLGKGTKVTAKIFLKIQEEVLPEKLAGASVLIVDKDASVCRSVCGILDDLGMRGKSAGTRAQALELIRERHKAGEDFYAVIFDWKVLGTEAAATVEEIHKEVGASMPVVISSEEDWLEMEAEVKSSGATTFIGEPFSRTGLVHLFRSMEENGGLGSQPAINVLAERDFGGHMALLVEDNEANHEIAEEIFKMVGIRTEHAWNGKEAVKMLTEKAEWYYDIVFMDIQMPEMNGYEATKVIRSLGSEYAKTVPILALSANAFAEDVQMSLSVGMNEHIAKPLDFRRLADALDKWLPSAS